MNQYLITGASSGIGLGICQALLSLNEVEIINVSRRKCPLDDARIYNESIDLGESQYLEQQFKSLTEKYSQLHALILCAGQGTFRNLEEFSHQDMQQLMQVNFLSHALLLKTCLPQLKKRKAGKIIIMGSESALQGGKQGSIYCASKFALRGMALALRKECAKSNIHISLINPGMVDSPFFTDKHFKPGQAVENSISINDIAELVLTILRMQGGSNIDEINLSPLKKVIDFSPSS